MMESYVGKDISLETRELIVKINEILETYDIAMAVRQLFYQCVSQDMLPNTVSSYRKVVRDCVELDALRPDVLEQRVEDFILGYLDRAAYDKRIEEEERQRGLVKIDFSGS